MKLFFKRFIEKLIEGILFLSSTVTSLAIVLIVIFLFKEGISLYNSSPLENGFVLLVSSKNPVNKLTAAQTKIIFDQNITNWRTITGKNDTIILLRSETIEQFFTDSQIGDQLQFLAPNVSKFVDSLPGTIVYLPEKMMAKATGLKKVEIENVGFANFFGGHEWFPTAQPAAQLGVLPLVIGTFLVSFFAILFALPLGLATAIYMAEIADIRMRNILKPIIELLAGIPSVVYGFFGLIVIVPLLQKIFNLPVGETALAGSIVLAIMALPTIISISEDALRTTPRAMREASLALGASKWQTISKVVVPYSISGITAAAILGIGRAVGETMAVLMVTGNAAVMPHTLLEPVRTIPATIAAELGEAAHGGLHYKALFALGIILFFITMLINLIVEYVSSRNKLLKSS